MTMFHKIRLRLTLLSGGTTTLILIVMTLGYLYISEKNLMQNRLLSWQNDISSIAFDLEQQTVITHSWLSSLEGRGSYYVSVLDNGTPFLFNNISHGKDCSGLLDPIWAHYRQNAESYPKAALSYRSSYKSFLYQGSGPQQGDSAFYCFVITLDRTDTPADAALEMLLAAPLSPIRQQIWQQRMIFACIILSALAAIWLFAWSFTGKLLHPIEENRKKQIQFVASASHELRTPLAVILSCAEAALDKAAPGRDLAIIKSEALRMSTLLEDLLTLSGASSGQLGLDRTPTELDTLLLDTCESFEPMARAKDIRILASLPDGAVPLCCCDKGRIHQVLAILIHNAVSYTPEGGQITLSVAAQDSSCCLTVSDTGPGIPDGEKEKVFDRFYRSEKARSAKGHFGLGLSIAYEIVAAHHGIIRVRDNAGGGAVFEVQLPLR